ncbi:MAG: hypothetical protein WCG09_07880 [Halobacteriota archaeon]
MKLLIVSASSKIEVEPPTPVPALQRFDGAFVKQIRKYHQSLQNVDVLMLSPVYGLVAAEERLASKEPFGGHWNRLALSEDDIIRLRQPSLQKIRYLLEKNDYEEVYLNLGTELSKIIEGFELMLPKTTRVIYAQGKGMGPKMAHMKRWLIENTK